MGRGLWPLPPLLAWTACSWIRERFEEVAAGFIDLRCYVLLLYHRERLLVVFLLFTYSRRDLKYSSKSSREARAWPTGGRGAFFGWLRADFMSYLCFVNPCADFKGNI